MPEHMTTENPILPPAPTEMPLSGGVEATALPNKGEKKQGKRKAEVPTEAVSSGAQSPAFDNQVAATFASNPKADYLYFLSNGWAFFTEAQARAAAQGMPDITLRKINNPHKSF